MSNLISIILEVWHDESISKTFCKLPTDILKLTREFLSKHGEKLNGKDQHPLQARVIQREMEMLQYVVKDILKLRRVKLERSIKQGNHVDTGNLLPFEKELLNSLMVTHENYLGEISLQPLVKPSISTEGEHALIYMLEGGEGIVDFELRYYGPFKSEDIVYLPKENAEIVVKGKRAKVVSLQK